MLTVFSGCDPLKKTDWEQPQVNIPLISDGSPLGAKEKSEIMSKTEKKNTFANDSVKRAFNHILGVGFDDIIKRPIFHPHFEHDILKKSESVQKNIFKNAFLVFNKNNIGEMSFSPVDNVYVPKQRFIQRKCAYLEPEDCLKYLSLVVAIAGKIEQNRIPRQKNIVHSYRYNKTGKILFSKNYNYGTFRKQSQRISSKTSYKYKIITDIAGFYEKINIHRIESQLLSIGCDPNIVSKINQILLTWAGRDSYGLPVGGDASRILAEASLLDLDRFLVRRNIPYIRFVDDFRIFAKDMDEAAYYIQILQGRLAEDGLLLSTEKTEVVDLRAERTRGSDKHFKKDTDQNGNDDTEETEREAKNLAWSVYRGKVPLAFRRPTEPKKEDLKKLDVDAELQEIDVSIDPELGKIKDVIRAVLLQESSSAAEKTFSILKIYIELVPYTVDMLISMKDEHPNPINKIRINARDWLLDGREKPDYVVISLVRLLAEFDQEIESVLTYLERLPRHGSTVVGREIFLLIIPRLGRSELLQMKQFYWRATPPERRALIRSVIENKSIHKKEKEPWLKTIRSVNADIFIEDMISRAKL